MKRCSTLSRSPELEPHHHMQLSVIPRILHFLGVLPLRRKYSKCNHHHQHVVPLARKSPALSLLLPIVHRLRQVFRTISSILTELLYVCSSWSLCFCSAICEGPLEYITYKLIPASPAVSCMSGSFNLNSFRDGR